MALPTEVRSHHTVWVDLPGGRTVALRYALGRNSQEVEASLEAIRSSRRLVALED